MIMWQWVILIVVCLMSLLPCYVASPLTSLMLFSSPSFLALTASQGRGCWMLHVFLSSLFRRIVLELTMFGFLLFLLFVRCSLARRSLDLPWCCSTSKLLSYWLRCPIGW